MIIKKIVKEDLPQIAEFQLENWPDIIPDFKFYLMNSFTHPVKMIHKEKIVGIGCGITFGKTAWLGHIIVEEKYRNKGVGSNLVDYLCNYLKRKGARSISLITTPGAYKFYEKLGFKVDSEYIFLERDGKLESIPSALIDKPGKDEQNQIIKLDKKISGENRSHLLYDNFKNSYIYQDEDGIQGYYIPDLGEGLIIAGEVQAGLELMKLRCKNKNQGVLPLDNTPAVNFLLDQGFYEIRRVKRMVRGEKFSWDSAKIFNRIAGNMG